MKKTILRLSTLLISVFILLFFSEILSRLIIQTDVCKRCRAVFYDDVASEDRYRLNALWGNVPEKISFDPLLGYARDFNIDQRDSSILFFGDSFVEGFTRPERSIPSLMDASTEKKVYNFGVSGYGLDQVYLHFLSKVDSFVDPHILIGIFYNDVDRVAMSLREAPKPHYINGDLQLPPDVPPGQWKDHFPFERTFYSIFLLESIMKRICSTEFIANLLPTLHPSQLTPKKEKKEISSFLIQSIKSECKKRNLKLDFVLFNDRLSFRRASWHKAFLEAECGDYISLYDPMQTYMSDSLEWYEVFSLNEHPDSIENKIIADYICRHISE